MSDINIGNKTVAKMGALNLSEDAHARVAILFEMSKSDPKDELTLIAISVKWLLVHGVPVDPRTGVQMKYHGTHIVQ